MGFGGPTAPRSDQECDFGETAEALEGVLADLSRIRRRLEGLGAPLAATYAEGAWDALSHSLEALIWSGRRSDGDATMIGGFRLRLRRDGRSAYADVVDAAAVSPPPLPVRGRAIGADLAATPAIAAALRADEVAASLMAAALSHSDWIHLETDEVFRADPLAAHAVVATIAGRTSFPSLTRRQMGGLVHRGSADALAGLGWRRMTGPALPGS